MAKQSAYKAILTLTPPTDSPIKVNVMLYPTSLVGEGGKRLGDCTYAELLAYAHNLESEVAETYQDISIRELLVEPTFQVAIDAIDEDWLDHVVVLEDVVSAENRPQPEVDAEIDPILAALEATTAIDEDISIAPAIADEEIVLEAELDQDALDAIEAIEANAVVEEVAEAEVGDSAEIIPIEEIDPPEINIEQAEQIYEERVREAGQLPSEDQSPDVRTAGILPDGAYPSNNSVIIWLDEPPLRLMQGHARSSLRREVAGVMVGPRPEKQPDGRYVVHITDMIIAKHTKMSGASVTYTPESWRYLNDSLAEMYPDGDHVMLGWYHTHPGFGIFLSNMDLFIHTNFFTQKWHIAYVLDPVGFKSGFFSWDRNQTDVIKYGFPWPNWTSGSW